VSGNTTREDIIDAADKLFYQRGFEFTSFADIAGMVKISRGNFYYHFKSKDEILTEVIDARLERTKGMLEAWEEEAVDPAGRIRCYMRILITNWEKIRHYGCPVGTLCTELAKLNHASLLGANKVFTLFRVWLRKQFEELGLKREADKLAMRVLAQSQGIATLGNAFDDKKFITNEVKEMENWLECLIQQKN